MKTVHKNKRQGFELMKQGRDHSRKNQTISIRRHLPLAVRVHYDTMRNFVPIKLFGLGIMALIGLFGLLLAMQVVGPQSSASGGEWQEAEIIDTGEDNEYGDNEEGAAYVANLANWKLDTRRTDDELEVRIQMPETITEHNNDSYSIQWTSHRPVASKSICAEETGSDNKLLYTLSFNEDNQGSVTSTNLDRDWCFKVKLRVNRGYLRNDPEPWRLFYVPFEEDTSDVTEFSEEDTSVVREDVAVDESSDVTVLRNITGVTVSKGFEDRSLGTLLFDVSTPSNKPIDFIRYYNRPATSRIGCSIIAGTYQNGRVPAASTTVDSNGGRYTAADILSNTDKVCIHVGVNVTSPNLNISLTEDGFYAIDVQGRLTAVSSKPDLSVFKQEVTQYNNMEVTVQAMNGLDIETWQYLLTTIDPDDSPCGGRGYGWKMPIDAGGSRVLGYDIKGEIRIAFTPGHAGKYLCVAGTVAGQGTGYVDTQLIDPVIVLMIEYDGENEVGNNLKARASLPLEQGSSSVVGWRALREDFWGQGLSVNEGCNITAFRDSAHKQQIRSVAGNNLEVSFTLGVDDNGHRYCVEVENNQGRQTYAISAAIGDIVIPGNTAEQLPSTEEEPVQTREDVAIDPDANTEADAGSEDEDDEEKDDSRLIKTGNGTGNGWSELAGYILIAAALLGAVRILIVKKYRQMG